MRQSLSATLVDRLSQPRVATDTQRCLQRFDSAADLKQTKPTLARSTPYPHWLYPLAACSTAQRDAIGRRSRPSRHGPIPQRPRLHRVELASAEVPAGAESARGISPRAAHRSGLDTLASSGSCHQPKAAAFRRELELLLSPVGPLPTSVTCPLCSTGITPLHHYYGAVRPWPAHQYFRPRGWAACAFSLRIADQVLKFHARAQMRVTPPIHRTPYGQ